MDCVCNDYVCNVSCCFLNLDFLVFYRRKIFKKSSHVIMSIILSRLLQYESSDCLIIIDVKYNIKYDVKAACWVGGYNDSKECTSI